MKSFYGAYFELEMVTLPTKITSSEEIRANFTVFLYLYVLNQRDIPQDWKSLSCLGHSLTPMQASI